IATLLCYADLQVQDKAMNLGIFELLDKAERYNDEEAYYEAVTAESLQQTAQKLFTESNCSTLYYRAKM
ncbi:MAG: insulinase family protein, partial [Bacteroidales bacterium]|nr:insulinase family protein [Bacteroidales bacterium]